MINLITKKNQSVFGNNSIRFDTASIHTGAKHAAEEFDAETNDIFLSNKYAIYSINFSANIAGISPHNTSKLKLGIKINDELLPYGVMISSDFASTYDTGLYFSRVSCSFPYKLFEEKAKIEIVNLGDDPVEIGAGANLYIRRIA